MNKLIALVFLFFTLQANAQLPFVVDTFHCSFGSTIYERIPASQLKHYYSVYGSKFEPVLLMQSNLDSCQKKLAAGIYKLDTAYIGYDIVQAKANFRSSNFTAFEQEYAFYIKTMKETTKSVALNKTLAWNKYADSMKVFYHKRDSIMAVPLYMRDTTGMSPERKDEWAEAMKKHQHQLWLDTATIPNHANYFDYTKKEIAKLERIRNYDFELGKERQGNDVMLTLYDISLAKSGKLRRASIPEVIEETDVVYFEFLFIPTVSYWEIYY